MHRRQPLPRLWLMTDERQGEALWRALEKLPRGSGVVFRHYSLPEAERRELFLQVQGISRSRDCILMVGGPPALAADWGADGSHGWGGAGRSHLLTSLSVHDAEEMRAANRLKPDLAFVSPVFETQSHPGKSSLGIEGLSALAALATMPVIALGGMNEERARLLTQPNIYGWAAIDAWSS
jgi:thiamine-phosphate pyrophosphorylase